jgi:Trk K+ transport system NAD-binding subunit
MGSAHTGEDETVAGRLSEPEREENTCQIVQQSERRPRNRARELSNRTVVIGGGQLGRLVARQLIERGVDADRGIHYVDDDDLAISRAAPDHGTTLVDDLTNGHAVASVTDGTAAVVVAAPSDAATLLVVGQLAASTDVARVVAVVRNARNRDAFPSTVDCVCATTLLAEAVVETLR